MTIPLDIQCQAQTQKNQTFLTLPKETSQEFQQPQLMNVLLVEPVQSVPLPNELEVQ